MCNDNSKICLESLIQELANKNWRDNSQDEILKIAFERGIIQNIPASIKQLTEEDKETLEFMLVMVYIEEQRFYWNVYLPKKYDTTNEV